MADADIARLNVRIAAETSRFQQGTARADAAFSRFANSTEARVARLDARLATVGSRFGAGFGTKMQQVGFQVGDFATQVSMGGNALTAFSVQGAQLLGAFGPWGAVIGAAGAVVGALAVSLWDAEGATVDLSDAQGLLEESGARVDDLNAQIANSSGVVREALIRERDATLNLLRARLALAKEALATRQAEIRAEAAQEVRQQRISGAFGSEVSEGLESVLPNDPRAVERRIGEFIAGNPELAAEIAGLESRIAVTETGLEKLATMTTTPAGPVFAVPSRPAREPRGGGGGSARDRKKPEDDIAREVDAIRERIAVLRQEQTLIGKSEAERVRLTAAYERQRLSEELLNKARAEGINLSPEQIAQVEQHAAAVESLTLANFDLEAAYEAQAKAAEDAKKRQEELARSITDVADRLIGAVQQAESFVDALKQVGLEILRLSVQGLGGQGPLGGLLGNLIPGLFGGGLSIGGSVGGLFSGPTFVTPSFLPNASGNVFRHGNVIPFAKGGVVSRPTTFPMANGAGLMGEAGPEAIMPLKRGPGGRLGVEGGGGGTVVNVYAPPGSEVREERSQSGGMEQVNLFIEQAVARGIATPGSAIQRALSTGFGARPVTTRR